MLKIKNIFSGYNYLSIYLAILILLNLFLLTLPLAKVFGYEFSAINAVVISFLSGLYSISLLKKINAGYSSEKFSKILLMAFVLFLIIPAAISIIHSLATINCSLKDGIAFYLALTFPSVLVGLFLGLVSFSLLKRYTQGLFVVIFLLILAIPFAEFYFNPQVYFFNPLFGFFPGTIYDEGLSVSLKLVAYRLLNTVFFGAGSFLILYSIFKAKILLQKIFIIICVIVSVIFYAASPVLGYSTTAGSLKEKLGGEVSTEHFNIYYPISLDSKKVEAMVLYHEYFYRQLKEFFGYDLKDKLNSFIFLNDQQKKELFGSANADIAKPWLNETFISAVDYRNILKHELAHCYSAEFGTGLLKVAHGLNPFLIEGIAVAADPVYDDNSIDFMAALAFKNGYKVNISSMLGNFSFYTQASSVSYIYAGAFVKYLVDIYGINKFKKFYGGGNFYKAYGISLQKVEKSFYNFLAEHSDKTGKAEANYYFGRQSIFYKVCPRYVNDRLEKAWVLFNGNNINNAEKIFEEILNKTNSYSALVGYAESLAKLNKTELASQTITMRIKEFANTGYYYNLELRQADLMVQNNEFAGADSVYTLLKAQAPSRVLSYLAALRLAILHDSAAIKLYLEGSDFDKYFMLKKLNDKKYNYASFPVLINLSAALDENYKLFLNIFNKPVEANDYMSSYALYKLSLYMLDNLDFLNARKTAAMALRHYSGKNFNEILTSNLDKCEWILLHKNEVLSKAKYSIIN